MRYFEFKIQYFNCINFKKMKIFINLFEDFKIILI